MRFYPLWDDRCSAILRRLAAEATNREIADAIAAATGQRFTIFAISRRRARLGIRRRARNDWSAALVRWRAGRSTEP